MLIFGLVKQVQISDLLALRGIPPPPPHPITTIQPNRLEEIKAVFLATYAPAIDKFFETRWFQDTALTHLLANAQLMAEYSALIEAFNDQNLSDPNVIARLESFEASVVWSSMTLCRHVMNVSNGSHGQDYDLLAASKRLDVIESMITGEHLDSNPLSPLSHFLCAFSLGSGMTDLAIAVTGWKSVYVNKGFTRRINGVTKDESDMLLQYLFNVSWPDPLCLKDIY